MTFTEVVELEKMTCKNCNGIFALNREYILHQRTHAGGYYCPYCQTLWVWRESESDKLRKLLAEKHKEVTASKCEAMRERQLKEETSLRMKAERKLKRVDHGVCPCCNRTFRNLARHMASKHLKIPESFKQATREVKQGKLVDLDI